MDGDLNLAETLGGLRIANPDDSVSPVSSREEPAAQRQPISPFSIDQISRKPVEPEKAQGELAPPTLETTDILRSTSPLDFNPGTFSADPGPVSDADRFNGPTELTQSPHQSPTIGQAPIPQPYSHRSSIPHPHQDQQQAQYSTYPTASPQDQQQAQFLTYPPVTPQAQIPAISNHRPISAVYNQPPLTNGITGSKREGSYRSHDDPTNLQRHPSRAAATALQAGVPTNEGDHTERVYRGSQTYTPNDQLPIRKSSRNLGAHQSSVGPASRSKPYAPGPYGVEGGPMKSSEEWQDRGAAVGMRKETDGNGQQVLKQVKKGVKDFQFGRTLGEGSYSTVMAASDRQTGREYAIKVLDKRHIIKEKKVKYVNIEKDTLNRLIDHPGIVRLYYTFQDESSLYFVLDLCASGELLGVLKRTTTFDEEGTRFYGAEILDTVDYMHSRGVIHRDLKPENVLLDGHMHVKITDFGTAKILEKQRRSSKNGPHGGETTGDLLERTDENKANSFVGTAEYVSPELLTDKKACKASDLWAFGCIIYQLLAGRPPFKAGNEYLTFQKIVSLDYQFPQGFPEAAKDLVERLLVLDPASRLSIEHVKNHEFFQGIKWGRGLWKMKAPKLKPYVPAAAEPIKLNVYANDNLSSYPPNIAPAHSTSEKRFEKPPGSNLPKAGPRLITELPPPSQLDIEWSPVLTHSNERILKMGNLLVNCTTGPSNSNTRGVSGSEPETPRKFSRFFGGGNSSKKRQRLVMVTTSARVIIVPEGGQEKKSKIEIELCGSFETSCNKMQDSKGLSYWCVDTSDKHYTFEDPKAASSDGSATSASAQEWVDTIEKAQDIVLTQRALNPGGMALGDDAFLQPMQPGPNTSRHLDLDEPPPAISTGPSGSTPPYEGGKNFLHKGSQHSGLNNSNLSAPSSGNEESFLGRKRFSKRQSKSGLAAVF